MARGRTAKAKKKRVNRRKARGRKRATPSANSHAVGAALIGQANIGTTRVTASGPFNDTWNAMRFVEKHGSSVRYVRAWKKWLYWDGQLWTEDGGYDHVLRLAKEMARSLYREAYDLPDEDARKRMASHAKRSGDANKINAMLEMVESEQPVAAEPRQFDQNPWLLCAQNGTIDLPTGNLLPHCESNLITKQAPVKYDPDATFPLWDEFLQRMVPDHELRDYLQRAIGWTITGNKGEEKLFFLHGPTSSGKSTFLEAILGVLGPYATTSDFKMLLERKNNDGPHPDLARHVGSRMVVSQEVNENRKFDAAAIKVMVSCNAMVAKRLYRDPFEFVPQWKVWLAANSQPRVDAEDEAAWRRIKVIPFTTSLPERERKKEVKETLANDPLARAAILAWAVKGCLAWRTEGLRDAGRVTEANQAYRDANDDLNAFLTAHYEIDPDGFVSSAAIGEAYSAHYGARIVPWKTLAKKLTDRGVQPAQDGPERTRGWKGLRLRTA